MYLIRVSVTNVPRGAIGLGCFVLEPPLIQFCFLASLLLSAPAPWKGFCKNHCSPALILPIGLPTTLLPARLPLGVLPSLPPVWPPSPPDRSTHV